ncbi:MAG: hypothetical protein G01um101413_827 [Parcubacteria group bacterium Gr01-1014_13]|nr:MAG: hypothetical protein G01um101413_827 [Parcubacteria group bacterium Gr01-1014_13]
MGTEDFKKVVAKYIGFQYSFYIWEEEKIQELVNKFGCDTKNTVIRWVLDMESPGQDVEKVVVQYIQSKEPVL